MPDVRTTHPEYDLMAPTWRKLRDVCAGRDKLIEGKTLYLPQPTNMPADRYLNYLSRPKWFGATRRTLQAFEGLAFRQPLSLAAPKQVLTHLEAVTSTGMSLTSLARLMFRETLLMGRYGVLVDMDQGGTRPWWAGYPAESILNWTTAMVEGRRQLTRVALAETTWVTTADGFGQEEEEAVRVLQLVDGVYAQTLYVVSDSGSLISTKDVVRERKQDPLTFIPFVFLGVNDLEPGIELSAVNDLADTNLAYWRHSADYEWSLHLTASPTPWVTGHNAALDVKPDGTPEDKFVLGSDTAIFLTEPDAKVGMLEFQGHGLEPLRQALTDDKLEMASLGARLLEGQPETGETLGAFRMRQTGDTSVIAALAQSLSTGLTRLLQYHAYWFGAATSPEDLKIRCDLPTNFTSARMEPALLLACMAMVQAGEMSQQTLYYNLQHSDLAEPGVSFDEERARIESATPAMARLLPLNGATNGVGAGV